MTIIAAPPFGTPTLLPCVVTWRNEDRPGVGTGKGTCSRTRVVAESRGSAPGLLVLIDYPVTVS